MGRLLGVFELLVENPTILGKIDLDVEETGTYKTVKQTYGKVLIMAFHTTLT